MGLGPGPVAGHPIWPIRLWLRRPLLPPQVGLPGCYSPIFLPSTNSTLARRVRAFAQRLGKQSGVLEQTNSQQYLQPESSRGALSNKVVISEQESQREGDKGDGKELPWIPKGLSSAIWVTCLIPKRETCDVLISAYFRTFGSVSDILEIQSFLDNHNQFWENRGSSATILDNLFVSKLLLVFALGSSTRYGQQTEDFQGSGLAWATSLQHRVRLWFDKAEDLIAQQMQPGPLSDLNVAQGLCLLALARHISAIHSPKAQLFEPSRSLGMVPIGMQMGLYRDPRQRCPSMPTTELELRRRLWATMLELSLQYCFDRGLPAPISPEDFDCEPPSCGVNTPNLERVSTPFSPSTALRTLAQYNDLGFES
ncbi:hypothetical protein BDP81DRAFT_500569 [Colletotrichum phormii]|uniref:Xylanolytic transcriptional activator regulatory domain-containing protein n=1 Tax=Colletotrichum phormii TaxID=359342 RepID=A0AAI9ZHG1_9PEZI|nr:uncharacterized protein BDP81DRAFT_500569 [Colletotrichum phormii]KAK1624668.1 hypothetical protein BDP81DRAFT_500569 [Colletotrichum phormii]